MRQPALAHLPFVLLAVSLLPACSQVSTQGDVDAMRAAWEESLASLESYQADLEAENLRLQEECRELKIDVERARAMSAREASAEIGKAFEELDRSVQALALSTGGGVEYLMGPDGPVIRIANQVLFASGSAKVSSEGQGVLRKLAAELAGMGVAYRVEGHTDDQPVKVRAKEYPHGNLELSTARAIEVAAILTEAGLPEERVAVTGYGEWRPVASNDTAEGRARNRRVEIAVVERTEDWLR